MVSRSTNVGACLKNDGYKVGHIYQYPEMTSFVHSNLTARSAKYATVPEHIHENKIVFFGPQYYYKKYLIEDWNENFFKQDIDDICARYMRRINAYLGTGAVTVDHIRDLHDYGKMPVRIKSLPEGVRVPMQVPPMVFESTQDRFYWVTNYLETLMSNTVWLPITSATTAHGYRKLISHYAELTGGSVDFIPIQGHDFSFRGMGGLEAALMSGGAHMTSFVGTDTIPAIDWLEDYYNADCEKEVIGISIPATEHAVMCMGTMDDEIGTYRRLMHDIYKTGYISIVSDTWDWWNIITNTIVELKDEIMARDGKVVLRPDSGDPVKIICGYFSDGVDYSDLDEARQKLNSDIADRGEKYDAIMVNGQYYRSGTSGDKETCDIYPITEAEYKGAVKCLWETFGGSTNHKGFKSLDPHIGLIYGDSINFNNCEAILDGMMRKGFTSDCCVFGFGSFGYQMVTRDTYGMAVKATFGIVDGEPRAIFKDPKTGSGKKSAKGLLAVLKDKDGEYYLRENIPLDEYLSGVEGDQLEIVFEDGELLIDHSLKDVRNRLWEGFGDFSLG